MKELKYAVYRAGCPACCNFLGNAEDDEEVERLIAEDEEWDYEYEVTRLNPTIKVP